MRSNKFQTPIEILNGVKAETIAEYEKCYGSLRELRYIEETDFYKDYLSKFDSDIELDLGENADKGFNSDLLLRLVAASFSSQYTLELTEDWKENPTGQIKARLSIFAECEEGKAKKSVDEMWRIQISRFYPIYGEEQMNVFSLYHNDTEEIKAEIEEMWNSCVAQFEAAVQRLHDEAELYLCWR